MKIYFLRLLFYTYFVDSSVRILKIITVQETIEVEYILLEYVTLVYNYQVIISIINISIKYMYVIFNIYDNVM